MRLQRDLRLKYVAGLKLRAEVILKLSGEPPVSAAAAGNRSLPGLPSHLATDLFHRARTVHGSPMLQRSPRLRRYRPPLRLPRGN